MFLRFLLIFLFISGCTNSTGFKSEPKGTSPKEVGLEQTGVTLNFHNYKSLIQFLKLILVVVVNCLVAAHLPQLRRFIGINSLA